MNDNYLNRFGGIARLYGTTALERFSKAHIAVVGIGGVGSWSVEALARSGIGKITMIDLDEICLTNINRQLHAMNGAIGQLKIEAMAERIQKINPACELDLQARFFSEKNAEDFFSGVFDGVIDAIDVVKPKCLLLSECKKRNIPVITCGGAGGRQDPTLIQTADLARTHNCALLNQVRKNLRSNFGFPKAEKKKKKFGIEAIFSSEPALFPQCDGSVSQERPEATNLRLSCESGYGSSTPMTATFGLFAAAAILKTLANKD